MRFFQKVKLIDFLHEKSKSALVCELPEKSESAFLQKVKLFELCATILRKVKLVDLLKELSAFSG